MTTDEILYALMRYISEWLKGNISNHELKERIEFLMNN